MTVVLSALAGLYPLASFLSTVSPGSLQRRYAEENAAVIASLPEAYVRNAYDAGPALHPDDVGWATSMMLLPTTPTINPGPLWPAEFGCEP